MPQYVIFFNQNWVGEHSEEWFASRAPLARAVVDEMRSAGVLVCAGGLTDPAEGFNVDATSGTLEFRPGPYVQTSDYLGGMTVVDVADDEQARHWAGMVAVACGWPQEVRRLW